MRKLFLLSLLLLFMSASGGTLAVQGPQHGDPLTAEQKVLLARYEVIRAALAADDLPGAKAAAAQITDSAIASQLSQSVDLAGARKSFYMLSRAVMKVAHGQPGYYIFHCPEATYGEEWGHWVQTTEQPANPYLGKANPACGKIMH